MADVARVLRIELPRKSVHLLAFLIPAASFLLGKPLVIFGLSAVATVYAVSEYLRVYEGRRTLFSDAYSRLFRFYEQAGSRIVVRPLYLAASILILLFFFPGDVAYAAIMLVSLGDGFARLERLLLGHSAVMKVGSGVGSFALGFLAASFFVEPTVALIASFAAYLLESLQARVDDNIAVPLGAAVTISFLQTTGLSSAIAPFIVNVDVSAYWWMAENRVALLYYLFLFLEFALPFAFAALILLYTLTEGWKTGLRFTLWVSTVILLVLIAKDVIARPRPCVYFQGQGVPLCPLSDYSFPSLHASLGGTFLAFPVQLRHGLQLAWRLTTVLIASIVLLLGPYTGIHWVSDVAGGFLLSTVLTYGTRQLHARHRQPSAIT